jgi:hypothetical protein
VIGLPRKVVLTAVLSVLLLGTPPAAAQDASIAVDSNQPTLWQGEVAENDSRVRNVPECRQNGCDKVEIDVRLPAALRAQPGGVELAIRAVGATPDDSLGFAVYQGTTRVALADAQIGTSRSVWLSKNNAHYTMYVFYNPFVPELGSTRVRYEGSLENESTANEPTVRDLLPDLAVLPQRFATFDTPPPFFDDTAAPGASCFRSEIQEQGARKCLRFGQAMANTGEGPVDVRYSTPAGQRPHAVPGSQRIHRSDGSFRDVASVGDMHYHPIHSHYHFGDFSISELWTANVAGVPSDRSPVAIGKKNGFCMADTELHWWARKGTAAQRFPAPRCLSREPDSPAGTDRFKNGISRGWADEYWWALPDQMIDVSTLSDGRYVLVTRIDPLNKIRELNDGNNCVQVPITLIGLATATPRATLGSTSTPC